MWNPKKLWCSRCRRTGEILPTLNSRIASNFYLAWAEFLVTSPLRHLMICYHSSDNASFLFVFSTFWHNCCIQHTPSAPATDSAMCQARKAQTRANLHIKTATAHNNIQQNNHQARSAPIGSWHGGTRFVEQFHKSNEAQIWPKIKNNVRTIQAEFGIINAKFTFLK